MTDIFEFSHRAVERMADAIPTFATALGLPGRDDRWDDFGPDGIARQRALFHELRDGAASHATPDRRSLVAQRVLMAEMSNLIDALDSESWRRDVNNIVSPWQDIRTIFDLMPTDTPAAWSNIVVRLEHIDRALDGYRASLCEGLAAGDVAARRQVEAAIEQGRQAAGDDSSFRELLDRFVADGPSDDAALAERLRAGVDHARRAYADMTDWFETTYLPAARDEDGVGRTVWMASAARFLGRTVDPESTSAWGWAELDRLLRKRVEIAERIDPTATVAEVMERVRTDPAMAAPSAEAFISIMQERQEQALVELDGTHFDVPQPIKTIEVRVAPPGGSTAPYYVGPSEDFSRPGRVMYPLDHRTTFALYDEITTAYHEGFPGHHLQVGWQVAMGDQLSRYHRLAVWYPGSGEGWALYAEHLMGELGFFEEPHYELGLVSSQIFRAARVVIDIGCHLGLPIPEGALGGLADFDHGGETWGHDLGLEMLTQVVHLDPDDARSEIVRYLGWPGQAISYKVGEQFILDLRATAQQSDDFDLKAFHADLLSLGSLGLDLLEELMTAPR